jgi:hypothetical protein
MVGGAFSSPHHFNRRVRSGTCLRHHGVEVDEGDPITWLRQQRGEA